MNSQAPRHVLRFTQRFLDEAEKHGGTPLGSKVLALLRAVEAAPETTGRAGLRPPFLRYAPVGHGAWYVNWVICRECLRVSIEDRPKACAWCSDPDEVIVLSLYVAF